MSKAKYIASPEACFNELTHYIGQNMTWSAANPIMVALQTHSRPVELDEPEPAKVETLDKPAAANA